LKGKITLSLQNHHSKEKGKNLDKKKSRNFCSLFYLMNEIFFQGSLPEKQIKPKFLSNKKEEKSLV